MHMMQDRRRFLTTLSSAGAAGLVGTPTSFAQGLQNVKLAQLQANDSI